MAMPWSRAKAKAAAIRADTTGAELARLNRLFDACFRIQREACEASGRHIPMVVENVKGAQPWVGKAAGRFGSFYLWGDVPEKRWTNPAEGSKVGGDWFGSYAEQKAAGTISPGRMHGKNSVKRKMASAMIAKIPLPLSRHIARHYHPENMSCRP